MKITVATTDAMILFVDNKCPACNIKKQFTNYYPFLKLEFANPPFIEKSFCKTVPLACTLVKELFNKNSERTINVAHQRTVTEVESDFKTEFGLDVQILRLSGNVWVETGLTEDWTLEKQNKEGEQISSHFPNLHKK